MSESRVRIITDEEALRGARVAVARLAPLTEEQAWEAAQGGDPYTRLSSGQLIALETLDRLDFLMTGQSRGCHYGLCREEPVDTSWRA